jgi:hypothetical protein
LKESKRISSFEGQVLERSNPPNGRAAEALGPKTVDVAWLRVVYHGRDKSIDANGRLVAAVPEKQLLRPSFHLEFFGTNCERLEKRIHQCCGTNHLNSVGNTDVASQSKDPPRVSSGPQALEIIHRQAMIDEDWTMGSARSFRWIGFRLQESFDAAVIIKDDGIDISRVCARKGGRGRGGCPRNNRKRPGGRK